MPNSSRSLALSIALVSLICGTASADASPEPDTVRQGPAVAPTGRVDDVYLDTVTEQGRRARGLYFPGHWVAAHGAQGVIDVLAAAGLDTAVIDVKNDGGTVLIDTHVPDLQRVRNPILRDLPQILRSLKDHGIYTIARMVCFKGSRLAGVRPTHAVVDVRPERQGRIWRSKSGDGWLDPSDPSNHELLRQLAVEVEAQGFDELQLDYIRFPVDAETAHARFRHLRPTTERWEPIHSMLRAIDESIHIPMSVDIFGVAALGRRDAAMLGQNVERWREHIEVFSPMLYANNFRSWRAGYGEDRGESFIRAATEVMRTRVGDDIVLRPYLQAFPQGASRPYGDRMIAGQIEAARSRRADGFLFWNPLASYRVVAAGMRLPMAREPFDWRTRR